MVGSSPSEHEGARQGIDTHRKTFPSEPCHTVLLHLLLIQQPLSKGPQNTKPKRAPSTALSPRTSREDTQERQHRCPSPHPVSLPSVGGHEQRARGAHPLQPPVPRHEPSDHPVRIPAPRVVESHAAPAEADGEQPAACGAVGHPFGAKRRDADRCSSARHARELKALFLAMREGGMGTSNSSDASLTGPHRDVDWASKKDLGARGRGSRVLVPPKLPYTLGTHTPTFFRAPSEHSTPAGKRKTKRTSSRTQLQTGLTPRLPPPSFIRRATSWASLSTRNR